MTAQGVRLKKIFQSRLFLMTIVTFSGWVGANNVHAISLNPSSITGLNSQDMVDSLLKTVALGAEHRDYMSASDLGIALGFDLGVDVRVIKVPSAFGDALNIVTGQSIPAYIPVPRLVFHKGFPFGVDLGFSYFGVNTPDVSIKMYGGEVQWSFLRGNLAMPSMALRATANYSALGFINTHTYKADIVASKSLLLLEPYFGAGLQSWSGDLNFPVHLGPLPATISGHSSGSNTHYFGGLIFKLLFARIAVEADYSTARVTSYGMKLSLGF